MKKTLKAKVANAGGNVITGARLVKCFIGDTNDTVESVISGEEGDIEILQEAVLSLDSQVQALQAEDTRLAGLIASSLATALGVIAAEYDATQTYAVGAYCIHGNGLYKCSTAIEEAEAWNAEHWTATTVMAEIAG